MNEKKKRRGPPAEIIKVPLPFEKALSAGLETGTPPPEDQLPKKKRTPRKPKP